MTDNSSADRPLLSVADQHGEASGRQLWTIFLEAGQNGKIALIHQLAAETLHVARAGLLLLIRAAMSKGAGRSWDRQQDERQKEFTHGVTTFQPWTGSGDSGGAKRRSFHHHRMVVLGRRWGVPQQQNERNGDK
jgi:hypothetical protein